MHDLLTDPRIPTDRAELRERIARAVPMDGVVHPLPGLHLARASSVVGPIHSMYCPSFCIIARGAKEIYLGEQRYRYDPYHYLLATIELPVVSQIVDASPEEPYLSLRMDLDTSLIASVMLEAGLPSARRDNGTARALDVSPLDADLLEGGLRLARLVEASPSEARILMPLVIREIVFRLLIGEQGARLRHIALLGGVTDRIARAVERLRTEFDKPLRIDHLAHQFGMSSSAFHEHFKAVMAMSPLQFQKHLRLQEARRLMLGEDLDASGAAFRVGYEDISQFTREYKRLFGEPPMRDVGRIRADTRSKVGQYK